MQECEEPVQTIVGRHAGACRYHLQNIITYENQVLELIGSYHPMEGKPPGQGMALSAEKIDFEFHTLTMALKPYIIAHYKFVGVGWINIFSGEELSTGIAMPKEIIQNELLAPKYSPLDAKEHGLGMGKLMSEHLSYLFTLSLEMFRALGFYK